MTGLVYSVVPTLNVAVNFPPACPLALPPENVIESVSPALTVVLKF